MEEFSQPAEQRSDRPPRVPLKAIEGIDITLKISIFYKDSRHAPTMPLVQNYSREALTVFSDRARRSVQDGSKLFTFNGGDKQAIKDILDWIMLCVDEKKAVHFQTYEETTPHLFTRYARAIEVANYLGIPARDFSEGLTKRMISIARKNLMPWSEVEYFLDRYHEDGLREVAATSVFFGWWRGELDEDKTPDDMCFLSVLREERPSLDDDLHEIARKNEEDIREKWAKKDAERRGETVPDTAGESGGFAEGGGGGGGGWGNDDYETATAAAGGWDTGDTGGGASGDWDTAPAATSDWDKENVAPPDGSSPAATPAATGSSPSWDGGEKEGQDDWADEMNEEAAPISQPVW